MQFKEIMNVSRKNSILRVLSAGFIFISMMSAGGIYQIEDLVSNFTTEPCFPENQTEWSLNDHLGNVNGGNYRIVWINLFDADSPASRIEAEFTEIIFNEYRNEGLALLGAGSHWVEEFSCENWGSEFGLSYPITDDTNMMIRSLFTDGSVPHHILLDHEMRVLYSGEGTIMPATGNQFLDILVIALNQLESLMVVPHLKDWNMVGLPIGVADPSQMSVFTGSIEGTLFSFNESYISSDELTPGVGYWLHFPYSGHIAFNGTQVNNVSISISQGWNIISGLSHETYVEDIVDPDHIIIPGSLYSFDGSYVNALSLLPGKGYWINSFSSGTITINTGGSSGKIKGNHPDLTQKANRLNINGRELYFGVPIPELESIYYQLPPKPPANTFDARYQNDTKLVDDFGKIDIVNPEKTLTIFSEIQIQAESHTHWALVTSNGDEFVLGDNNWLNLTGNITSLTLQKIKDVPSKFSLLRNYPNPFNPKTTIEFQIPSSGVVSLKIIDIMGNEIRQLIQSPLNSGYHTIQWDGTDNQRFQVGSGCYFYQLEVNAFSKTQSKSSHIFKQTKKMVLLK